MCFDAASEQRFRLETDLHLWNGVLSLYCIMCRWKIVAIVLYICSEKYIGNYAIPRKTNTQLHVSKQNIFPTRHFSDEINLRCLTKHNIYNIYTTLSCTRPAERFKNTKNTQSIRIMRGFHTSSYDIMMLLLSEWHPWAAAAETQTRRATDLVRVM